MLEKLFHLTDRGSNVRTELIAGLTTFITMAYILFLAPNILSLGGMDKEAVLIATALGGGLVSIAVGLIANYPICFAPGVGLLAFYSFTVVLGMGIPWQTALGAVFISGLVFLALTVTHIRQLIIEAIPPSLKVAITVGIGLFISIIGLKLSGLMSIRLSLSPETLANVVTANGNFVPGASETLLELGVLTNPEHIMSIFAIVFTAILMARNVQGAMVIGILVTTVVGYASGVAVLPEQLSFLSLPDFSKAAIGELNISDAFHMGLVTIVFTFTFTELFDSMGTMIGTATKAGIADPKTGKFPGLGKALTTDAVGVCLGAFLGVSTVTAFVESTSGVSAGGKTGLTAVACGVLFFLSLLFAPLIGLVPGFATNAILILVGVLMMGAVKDIDFEDISEGFPAFMTIVMMPFTYSIANGIAARLIFYPVMKVMTGRYKEVHPALYILALVVAVKYIWF